MPETMNTELAHKLGEREAEEGEHKSGHEPWQIAAEIVEVIVLAVVAVATAWSGFQATKWDGRQSLLYGHANSYRFEAESASTYGGQLLAADAGIFTAWLQAHESNETRLESFFVRRFDPSYRVAFDAWLKTDPFTNPNAPSGPATMPEYHNTYFAQATVLNEKASSAFDGGTDARDTADQYVRDTVLFAAVLFLVALAQRLRGREARIGLNVVAFGVLVYTLVSVLELPRL
jgi:hypothetical protein